MHYRPRTAILNNLEHDHADIFPDLAAIETQFHHLVRTVPASGRLVVNARDESLQRVLQRGCWSEVQRFGTQREEPGGLCARGEPHAFDVLRGSLKLGRVEWSLLGEHNQMNALAAIGAAEHVGVAPEVAAPRWPASRTCAGAWSCAARPPASRSTTTSRTTRPRCAPPSTACGTRSTSSRRRRVRHGRGSWPCSSRARTR